MASDAELRDFRIKHIREIASAGKAPQGAFDDTTMLGGRRWTKHETLVDALRRRFPKGARQALAKLGISGDILQLAMDASMPPPASPRRDRLAFGGDDESENIPTRRMNDVSDQEPEELDPEEQQPDEEEHGEPETGEEDDELEKIMQVLQTQLSPEDCDQARQLISDALAQKRMRGAADMPPDLPLGGRPTAGGQLTPLKSQKQSNDQRITQNTGFSKPPKPSFDEAREARECAMDAMSRIKVDNLGVQTNRDPGLWGEFRRQTPRKPQRQATPNLAMDERARQSFEQRFPGVSRIRVL
jgi:hypothetical protein